MCILFVLRGCIPVELQGPARFAKLHSEIVNVMKGSVDLTCYAGIRKDKKKSLTSTIEHQCTGSGFTITFVHRCL